MKAPWTEAFPEKVRARKPRKKLRKRSNKRQAEYDEYLRLRIKFLSFNPRCAVFHKLKATEIHHMRGRYHGLLNDMRYWVAVSRAGQRWITDNPAAARSLGLLCQKGEWGKKD